MNKSVYCPKDDEHAKVNGKLLRKTLFIVGEEGCIYAFCQKHRWMRVDFMRFGKKLDFSDITFKINEVSEKYIKNIEAPVVSVGKFEKKCQK